MPPEPPPDPQPAEAVHAGPDAGHPAVRITTPARLLSLVAYTLGFHPANSIVIVAANGTDDHRSTTFRFPLDDPGTGLATARAEHAVRLLAAQEHTRAALVGYGPEDRVTPFAGHFRHRAAEHGIDVQEFLRVQDGRYWSCLCTAPGCCPPEGTPYSLSQDPELVSRLPAGYPGVLESREDLAALVAPVTGAEAARMRQATTRAEARHRQLLDHEPASADERSGMALLTAEGIKATQQALQRFRQDGGLSPDEAAWLAVCLGLTPVRDDLWSRLEPEHCQQNLQFLLQLTRLAPHLHAAPAASLLAFTAWQCGNGALANIALDRALDDDPDYPMAELIRTALDAGAPPDLAKPPMTPAEVAAAYAVLADTTRDTDAGGGEPETER